MQKVYLGYGQTITNSDLTGDVWSFSNNGQLRGILFINPNSSVVYVNNVPIPAEQSFSFDVYPGEVVGNTTFTINLNSNTSITAVPVTINN